ncbi:MAG: sigma-70 family RNA polymerase sigma factor [Planctomycetales bacterium]|nr:sigma-70 family RNA polymerase sigma factor [Planctomycetales bacterium]
MSSTSEKSSKTSKSLIQRAAQNEPYAWEQFVDLYAPLVHTWISQRRIEPNAAADIVQDVFSSVHRSLARFSHSGGTFRGWLWTITRNKILDHARRESKQPHATGGSTAMCAIGNLIDESELPETEPTSDHQHAELIHRAVAQVQGEFAPKTWQAFWRTTVDGIRTDVVAEELTMTPVAVRQSKSRVLRRLRRQLGD